MQDKRTPVMAEKRSSCPTCAAEAFSDAAADSCAETTAATGLLLEERCRLAVQPLLRAVPRLEVGVVVLRRQTRRLEGSGGHVPGVKVREEVALRSLWRPRDDVL